MSYYEIITEVPDDWEEVAMITSEDQGCDDVERIIYKTPAGTLKVREADVIKDVTRDQVARWIHQWTIPEEFQADFSVRARGGGDGA